MYVVTALFYIWCLFRSRNNDPIQVMDEAKDSVPTLQLSKQEILTGYSAWMCMVLSFVTLYLVL